MAVVISWLTGNLLEIFGVITGILYVFLEIKQDLRLWPVGIVTSAIYIWVFFVNKLYADAGLQCYYLMVSVLGWYWWANSAHKKVDAGKRNEPLKVTHVDKKTAFYLGIIFLAGYLAMWQLLDRVTDSPVPAADAFITTLSAVATWMLARKIFEHWYLWIVVNFSAAILFFFRGLYPTIILYAVYCVMSFVGLREWKKTLAYDNKEDQNG
jgi:nicotinamide mononucleotide transporter